MGKYIVVETHASVDPGASKNNNKFVYSNQSTFLLKARNNKHLNKNIAFAFQFVGTSNGFHDAIFRFDKGMKVGTKKRKKLKIFLKFLHKI